MAHTEPSRLDDDRLAAPSDRPLARLGVEAHGGAAAFDIILMQDCSVLDNSSEAALDQEYNAKLCSVEDESALSDVANLLRSKGFNTVEVALSTAGAQVRPEARKSAADIRDIYAAPELSSAAREAYIAPLRRIARGIDVDAEARELLRRASAPRRPYVSVRLAVAHEDRRQAFRCTCCARRRGAFLLQAAVHGGVVIEVEHVVLRQVAVHELADLEHAPHVAHAVPVALREAAVAEVRVLQAWRWPAVRADELHHEDVVLQQDGLRRRDAGGVQAPQVAHLLLSPGLDHLARVRLAVAVTEAVLAAHVPGEGSGSGSGSGSARQASAGPGLG